MDQQKRNKKDRDRTFDVITEREKSQVLPAEDSLFLGYRNRSIIHFGVNQSRIS